MEKCHICCCQLGVKGMGNVWDSIFSLFPSAGSHLETKSFAFCVSPAHHTRQWKVQVAAGGTESTLNILRGILRMESEEVIKTSVSFYTCLPGGFNVNVFEHAQMTLHAPTLCPNLPISKQVRMINDECNLQHLLIQYCGRQMRHSLHLCTNPFKRDTLKYGLKL